MFYCYMNDEIVNQSSLFSLIKNVIYVLSSSTYTIVSTYYCSTYLSLQVDQELWSTLHAI